MEIETGTSMHKTWKQKKQVGWEKNVTNNLHSNIFPHKNINPA